MMAAVIVFSAINKRESELQRAMANTVEIAVAANDIPLGSKLEPDSVKLVRWARDSVPDGAFADPQAVAGSYAKSDFVANEPVVASKLFMGDKTAGVLPLLIPAGMRAMSVPVDEVSDIAGFVEPHSHVDVLVAVSGSGPDQSSFSRIVLQDIEVLAVAQEIEHVKDEPVVVRVVTLLVTPADAEKLTLASHEGLLRLAMRNYSDAKIVATGGVALPDLLHRGAPAATLPVMHVQPGPTLAVRPFTPPTPFRVDVMRDGKSDEAISFDHSGGATGAAAEASPQDGDGASNPQIPAPPGSPNAPETPVSSVRPPWSAGFTAPPPGPAAPGYQPAPATYQVP